MTFWCSLKICKDGRQCVAKGSLCALFSALLCVGILMNERAFCSTDVNLIWLSLFILLHSVNCIVSTRGSVLGTTKVYYFTLADMLLLLLLIHSICSRMYNEQFSVTFWLNFFSLETLYSNLLFSVSNLEKFNFSACTLGYKDMCTFKFYFSILHHRSQQPPVHFWTGVCLWSSWCKVEK